jgi:hypothetical protein
MLQRLTDDELKKLATKFICPVTHEATTQYETGAINRLLLFARIVQREQQAALNRYHDVEDCYEAIEREDTPTPPAQEAR